MCTPIWRKRSLRPAPPCTTRKHRKPSAWRLDGVPITLRQPALALGACLNVTLVWPSGGMSIFLPASISAIVSTWSRGWVPEGDSSPAHRGRTAAALPGCRRSTGSTEGWEDLSGGFYCSIRNCLTSALPYRAASSSFRAFASSGVMLPHRETL